MAIVPTFGELQLAEAAELMQGLMRVDLLQLRQGTPPISRALREGELVYIREDPLEHWRTIKELWRYGGGDCEDLACAVAAEMVWRGHPARPVIYHVRPGLSHAVVQDLADGTLWDPSRTGGMGARCPRLPSAWSLPWWAA